MYDCKSNFERARGTTRMPISLLKFKDQREAAVMVLKDFDQRSVASVAQGVPFYRIAPLIDAFNAEHGVNARLIKPAHADELLVSGGYEGWARAMLNARCNSFAVDAIVAFEAMGKPLGKEVVFALEGRPTLVLETGDYAGQQDVSLLVLGMKAGDFTFEDNDSVVRIRVSQDRLLPKPLIPAHYDQWYVVDNPTTLPYGNSQPRPQDGTDVGVRKIHRPPVSDAYVNAIRRETETFGSAGGWIGDGGHRIGLCSTPDAKSGIVVEMPIADAMKLSKLTIAMYSPDQLF